MKSNSALDLAKEFELFLEEFNEAQLSVSQSVISRLNAIFGNEEAIAITDRAYWLHARILDFLEDRLTRMAREIALQADSFFENKIKKRQPVANRY